MNKQDVRMQAHAAEDLGLELEFRVSRSRV